MKRFPYLPAFALVLAALILYASTILLSGVRNANIQEEHVNMMKTLLPGSESFVKEAYSGSDESIKSVHRAENGYVIECEHQGYVDVIRMMIGVSMDGHVTGLVVRDMDETPGLGMNAMFDHEFLKDFLNTSGEASVGENVDAITGATVTSKAVAKCVNSAVSVVTGVDASSEATAWGG